MIKYSCIIDREHIDIPSHKKEVSTTYEAAALALMVSGKTTAGKIIVTFLVDDIHLKIEMYNQVSLVGEGDNSTMLYEYKSIRKFLEVQIEWCVKILLSKRILKERKDAISQLYAFLFSDELEVDAIKPMQNGEEFLVYFKSEKKASELVSRLEYLRLFSVSEPYEVLIYIEK